MYDDPKRYENDGLYEDEDTEYEDEYEADDSDYIVLLPTLKKGGNCL